MSGCRKAWGAVGIAVLAALSHAARAAEQSVEPPAPIAELAPGEWRVSRLIGVTVYDLAGEKVGRIGDVVVDHDGAAKAAVIDLGGLFGLGKKSVALPFAAVKFVSRENATPKSVDFPPKKPPILAVPKLQARPGTEAGGQAERAVIRLTKAQLKAAPEFHYTGSSRLPSATPIGPLGPVD